MNAEPLVNVLRQTHQERLASNEAIQISYERIVNKVLLHAHSLSYCLKKVEKKTKSGEIPNPSEHILFILLLLSWGQYAFSSTKLLELIISVIHVDILCG